VTEGDDGAVPAALDAVLALSLFAVDSSGISGVVLKALAGPVRDQWLSIMRELLPPSVVVRRIPLHVSDARLLGGLDLAATLQAGRPIADRGLLAESNGGVLLLAMAERLGGAIAARLAAVLDSGEVVLERDGVALRTPARLSVIALDESMADDEHPPAALLDRLGLHIDLHGIRSPDQLTPLHSAGEILSAKALLPSVRASQQVLEAISATTLALGILSLRAELHALRVAHIAAALDGRTEVAEADAVLACRLVLAPRARALPAPPESGADSAPDSGESVNAEQDEKPAQSENPGDKSRADDAEPEANDAGGNQQLNDLVLAATQASIPGGLLLQIKSGDARLRGGRTSGRFGIRQKAGARGRPGGVRKGEPRGGARLNVLETLRTAAPWQRLRKRENDTTGVRGGKSSRIEVRREDFHITRHRPRTETTTIFVVDASGSSALHRLAEAKGAVELLLADCYVRRDRVAVVTFRGRGAEILLPPTRSLVRAKRSLSGLPGGGGTPLAAGIDAAIAMADAVRRRGETPTIVLLTDGKANIARDGGGGRDRAEQEALTAARMLRAERFTTLFIDTSPRPQAQAEQLAVAMGARYLALPHADAFALSGAVRAAAAASVA
jgi:magnesium chelatase subunit D